MARTLWTISKLSNSCIFPWLFVFLLNINQVSSQKNTGFVIYFGNESVPHFSPVLCVVFYTALLRQVFLLYHSLQHYLPLCALCRSAAKASLWTNSTIHHSVHLLCTVRQAQSHKLLPFIIPVLSHFVRYSLFNWTHFTSMVHVLTDDYHQNVCTNITSTPIIGKMNIHFLTSNCDTKYASSSQVTIWHHIRIPFKLKTVTLTDSLLSMKREFNFSLQLPFKTLFTQINIGYTQHGQKKCVKLKLLSHCNQKWKCWQIFWN
jgi:hypothetical protein